jgi:hypothetical protein
LGREEVFYFYFLLIRILGRSLSGARGSDLEHIFKYLVKDRYCAHAIVIKFVEAACKNWDRRG